MESGVNSFEATAGSDVLALGRAGSAPHIICFTVLYADGEVLVTELDRAGFAGGPLA